MIIWLANLLFQMMFGVITDIGAIGMIKTLSFTELVMELFALATVIVVVVQERMNR